MFCNYNTKIEHEEKILRSNGLESATYNALVWRIDAGSSLVL